MIIPQNKNVRQQVWHLQYVETAIEGIELYCYNTEGDRNSAVDRDYVMATILSLTFK